MNERDELAAIIRESNPWLSGHSSNEVADAVLAAGYHKGHEEWGVQYESTSALPGQNPTRVTPMPNKAHADAAVTTGAPIRARNRRTVHRYVTEWSEP
jgi:hypothetical protein